ncbi:STAS domain-containing protein [Janibacter melonis]|uniref:STAS domain-containing protein n=1 Tax=Janibacter melonis TaxID=262209 RepID=UPI0020943DEC|nr:STAS domain-containing protein [Janibacter melonis]
MALTISTSNSNGAVVVHCTGEIDVSTASQLRDAVQQVILGGSRSVAIDMTGVSFMDSTGLGVVVGRLKTLRREGGTLTIAATADRVRRVFEITGLDKVFVLYRDPADAARAAAETTG